MRLWGPSSDPFRGHLFCLLTHLRDSFTSCSRLFTSPRLFISRVSLPTSVAAPPCRVLCRRGLCTCIAPAGDGISVVRATI